MKKLCIEWTLLLWNEETSKLIAGVSCNEFLSILVGIPQK